MSPLPDLDRLSRAELKDMVVTLLERVTALERTVAAQLTRSRGSRAGRGGRTSSQAAWTRRRGHGRSKAVASVAVAAAQARAATSAVRAKERAALVLLRLEGLSVTEAAMRLGTTAKRVSMWTKRFETHGLAGLDDKPGRGRKSTILPKVIARIVTEAKALVGALAEMYVQEI